MCGGSEHYDLRPSPTFTEDGAVCQDAAHGTAADGEGCEPMAPHAVQLAPLVRRRAAREAEGKVMWQSRYMYAVGRFLYVTCAVMTTTCNW